MLHNRHRAIFRGKTSDAVHACSRFQWCCVRWTVLPQRGKTSEIRGRITFAAIDPCVVCAISTFGVPLIGDEVKASLM